jgi:hypothetical protein
MTVIPRKSLPSSDALVWRVNSKSPDSDASVHFLAQEHP